ncbi:hypothetical protein [Bacillus sp. Marseille-P3661]|uniref:hypothetical protein n=1 Tax=Bacillus sp. Marseille-P3661 TaxID=1936234 RepID=UPI000C84E030|nr:hypothetical protein [Bacillus sp. Marseille-P3661]
MYKTITLRVSKDELMQIEMLREQHFQRFKVTISQSQLIRNMISEKYQQIETVEKDELFSEKEQAHRRDMNIVDRLRDRNWGKARK